jgi:hypothetical protein
MMDLETMVLIVLEERLAALGSGLFPTQESGPRPDDTVDAGAGAALEERLAALGSGLFPTQESGPRPDDTVGAGAALTIVVAARAMMRVLNMVDIFGVES